jgi:hypothetical protein
MDSDGPDCGPLHGIYAAARAGDRKQLRRDWERNRSAVERLDSGAAERLADAVDAGETATAQRIAAELLFGEEQPKVLDGLIATTVGLLLHGFGYLASFVLFFRAHSAEVVIRRLRWAYRTVGVDIQDTESVDDIERTTFRCPYRNLGAERYGRRRVCHDVLDRVDDGYVTFLDRHRDIDYRRPRACAASECCYSEVTER